MVEERKIARLCDDGTEQNRKQKEKKKAEVVKKGGSVREKT